MFKKIILLLTLFILYNCNNGENKTEKITFVKKEKTPEYVNSPIKVEQHNSKNSPFSFSYLKTIKMDDNVFIYYNPEITEIINKDITEHGIQEYRVLKTKINADKSQFVTVDYSPGPSVDPGFLFHKNDGDSLIQLGYMIGGLKLYIPGNGYIYISGHSNNMFDERRKYKIEGHNIVEVKQPYYYVGIESKLKTDINLYSDINLRKQIGKLTKGSPVSVLINKDDFYLIKSSFGLVGWTKIELSLFPGKIIESIYFAGD